MRDCRVAVRTVMVNGTKITMAKARAFMPAGEREAVLWDGAAPGPGLRTQPSGHESWIVHRRCNGSVVRRTLDTLTVEEARHAARTVIAETVSGAAVVATSDLGAGGWMVEQRASGVVGHLPRGAPAGAPPGSYVVSG